jgi:chromosome segregation ATPase
MRYLSILFAFSLSLLLLGSGCDSTDLSLLNQVKRFEPEWMKLSEKVMYIDRNLRIAQRRYQEDFETINPYLSDPNFDERTQLYGLRSQYRNVMSDRDELQKQFDRSRQAFVSSVESFNDWQNKLMQGKLETETARQELADYQRQYEELYKEIDGQQSEVIANIETHNRILRQIASALGLFTNFDINPR